MKTYKYVPHHEVPHTYMANVNVGMKYLCFRLSVHIFIIGIASLAGTLQFGYVLQQRTVNIMTTRRANEKPTLDS